MVKSIKKLFSLEWFKKSTPEKPSVPASRDLATKVLFDNLMHESQLPIDQATTELLIRNKKEFH